MTRVEFPGGSSGGGGASEPTVAASGVTYVTTTGSDGASGASWASAKKTINAAIEALPEGNQALNETGITPRNGIVELGYGTFKGKSKSVESSEVHNETKSGRVLLDPLAVSLGVAAGMFCYCLDEWKNFPELAIVEKVVGEKVTLEGVETKWGVETPAECAITSSSKSTAGVTVSASFTVAVEDTKTFKAAGGIAQALNEEGKAMTFSYTGRSVTTGAGNIEGCVILYSGTGKIASGATVYSGTQRPYHAVVYVTPVVTVPPGVKIRGRGKHGGVGLKGSTAFGTLLEDEGNGMTIVSPAGEGEKGKSFVSLELQGFCVKGVGKECTESSSSPKAQSRGEREGGETIFGFIGSNCAEIRILDMQFCEHGYVGCVIGQQAVVTLHVEDCFFDRNGRFNNLYTQGSGVLSGGLWLCQAPNQGTLINNRYNVNFGVGLISEGGVTCLNDEHSHNFLQKNVRSGGVAEGCGLLYEGSVANGNLSVFYGWGEGNDKYEMALLGNVATVIGYTYRGGTTKETHPAKQNPSAARLGAGAVTFMGCQFGTGNESYWKQSSPEAADKKWIIEPVSASGILRIVGCEAWTGQGAEAEEKGVKNGGQVTNAVSRAAMNGAGIDIPKQTVTQPNAPKEETITSGATFTNKTGTDIEIQLGVVHEGASELNLERGAESAALSKICGTIKEPTTGTTSVYRILLPSSYSFKATCTSKCKIVGPTGTESKAIVQPV